MNSSALLCIDSTLRLESNNVYSLKATTSDRHLTFRQDFNKPYANIVDYFHEVLCSYYAKSNQKEKVAQPQAAPHLGLEALISKYNVQKGRQDLSKALTL